MQPPKLKTYQPGKPLPQFHYFIQCKGNHSGKPLRQPIPNCFVASCCNQEELDYWTAITNALFLSKRFELLIIGSVIPFIRLRETEQLLEQHQHITATKVLKTAHSLNLISELHRQSVERLKAIKQLEKATAQALTSLL